MIDKLIFSKDLVKFYTDDTFSCYFSKTVYGISDIQKCLVPYKYRNNLHLKNINKYQESNIFVESQGSFY